MGCSPPQTVHWHVKLDIQMCGENRDLPRIPPGQHHLGTSLLHTHDDNIIHVEGTITQTTDLTLGEFMDVLGLDFSETEFMGKSNGDTCGGVAGKWKMLLNGEESSLFRSYTIHDGDTVSLIFE